MNYSTPTSNDVAHDRLPGDGAAGIRAIIEPAFWVGQPRTQVGTFHDYFASLVGWERFRAAQFGIHHFCAIGVNAKEANDEALTKEALELVPRFAMKEGVVAVGEIGFDEITPAEERAFSWQLDFAAKNDLVVMVHSPHRDKKRGILRSLDLAAECKVPMGKLVIDHNNEETVQVVLDRGAWAAFTIYPHTKMGSERMAELVKRYGSTRMIVDSSADWGISDPLAVPKTAQLMKERGIAERDVELACWKNALDAYAQSGQIDVAALARPTAIDQSRTFNDNSVLRGQTPQGAAGVPN
jgi:predicted metal-dependent TIM-barrel fold hydrolase